MAQNQKLRDQANEQAGYINALNAKLDQLTVRVALLGETLAAVVDHLGEEVVKAKMTAARAKRKAEHEAKLEEGVEFLLKNGLAGPAAEGAVVELNSFVVADEKAPDGEIRRTQVDIKRLDKVGQARYMGKKVGDEITSPDAPGYTLTVRAIYVIDMVKVQEYAARKKAEALAARAAATAVPTPAAPAN